MRLACLIALTLAAAARAQVWERVEAHPKQPQVATTPAVLPPSITASPPENKLPRDENLATIDLRSFRVQAFSRRLVLTTNNKIFREYNPDSADAEVTHKLIQELQAVRWGTIGKSRIVVEYGLTTGSSGELAVPRNAGFPKTVTAIDLKSVRCESVRGAWCLLDRNGPLLNFGPEREEAEQALTICRKYGFNRIGTVGTGPTPAITYFFAAAEIAPRAAASPAAELQAQRTLIQSRSGIELPGHVFLGEKITFNARKLEVRRESDDATLRFGNEVIARFGSDEWAAQDAARVIQDGRFNEFCRVSGVTFFLKDGKAPTQVPFHARGTHFDAATLKFREANGQWMVTDSAVKPLFAVASEAEAADLIRVVKAFGFDTIVIVGNSPTNSLKYLVKSR